ncbi:hypothetical protein Ciccas_014022 [Cichlidogyrus casuarinus]|uniref:Distal-less homeobox protein 3a n=1 Tax=Cichlidogyrus casuarinus TaxID=1844966 RepID=A0ABD2PP01_9PLAT
MLLQYQLPSVSAFSSYGSVGEKESESVDHLQFLSALGAKYTNSNGAVAATSTTGPVEKMPTLENDTVGYYYNNYFPTSGGGSYQEFAHHHYSTEYNHYYHPPQPHYY